MKKSGPKKSRKPKAKVPEEIEFKSHNDLPFCSMSLSSTLSNKTGSWRSMKPVVRKEKCTSCLLCWKFCPEPCITMQDGIPVIDYDYCKGCGICAEVCAKKAIEFEEEHK